MKTLVLATALVAAVIAPPARAQTQSLLTPSQQVTAYGTKYGRDIPSSLTPSQQRTAYGAKSGRDRPSLLTPSQQRTAYGAR